MKKKHQIIFGLLLLITISLNAQAQASQALKGLIDEIVAPYLEANGTYGIAIGIIDSSYDYKYTYGKLSEHDLSPPDSNTIFHIGAITKVFTTSLLSVLAEEKIVQFSDSITQYLPDSLAKKNPLLNKITLAQLATHTSGFPKEPYNISFTTINKSDPYLNYHLQDAYQFLINYRPKATNKKKKRKKAKTTFKYSHLGMGLLGHLLENATGEPYINLLKKYIFKPLNMGDTHLELQQQAQNRLARGHHFSGKIAESLHYASLEGAEALYSTMHDLLLFLRANIQTDILAENLNQAFTNAQQPQVKTNVKWVQSAYGWYTINRGKKQPSIITHSGRTGGYSNFVAFTKETQTAVVVLSNSSERIDQLGIDILELLNR